MYNGFSPLVYDGVCDVQKNFRTYFDILCNKCSNLFKWEGLPDTVDERFLMEQLILNGKVCFTKIDNKLYALNGNVGGEPNAYYQPSIWIVANPVLGSKQVRIRRKDGSDSIEGLEGIMVCLTNADYFTDRAQHGGLFDLIYQTAGLLADNISSLNVSQINGRVAQLFTVDNQAEARTIEEIIRDMYDGHPYRVLTQDLISKVGVLPAAQTGQTNTLLNLIEAHQYILASFFNEIGIPSNWNMKRERVNTAETQLMTGSLDISVYSMERNLQREIEKVNELFGTEISVVFNGIKDEEDSTEDSTEELTKESEDSIPQEEPVKEESNEEAIEVKEEVKEVKVEGGDE